MVCPKKGNAFCAAPSFLPMRASAPCAERPPCSRLPCDLLLLPFRVRNGKRGESATLRFILSFRCGATWRRILFCAPAVACVRGRQQTAFAALVPSLTSLTSQHVALSIGTASPEAGCKDDKLVRCKNREAVPGGSRLNRVRIPASRSL